MAGRFYSATFANVDISAICDIWQLATGSGKGAQLHEFRLTSGYQTDERLQLRLLRRTSGDTAVDDLVECQLDAGNAIAASVAASGRNTTRGTAGNVIDAWLWSQQGELIYLPTPELRPAIPVSSWLALELVAAPAGTRKMSGSVKWEEY